ncbi:MAG TPA: YidB family protein [Xanthobacteraceae bacterium]|nr:YidB family protein [Xanthobacteraceae bacterium]
MGLLDVLNGMQNGPRGPSAPGKGGMSPLTMALLGLLAYKAVKKFSDSQPHAIPAGGAGKNPTNAGNTGGGLGDLLPGGLGGLLAGGAAGSVLSGGLNDLVKQLQQGGLGDAAKSWVGTGPNKSISAADLAKVLDNDQIKTLMAQAGISRDDLLNGLSQQLPELIDKLTPDGRLPTEQEMAHRI